jgi:hypothetical protein
MHTSGRNELLYNVPLDLLHGNYKTNGVFSVKESTWELVIKNLGIKQKLQPFIIAL